MRAFNSIIVVTYHLEIDEDEMERIDFQFYYCCYKVDDSNLPILAITAFNSIIVVTTVSARKKKLSV